MFGRRWKQQMQEASFNTQVTAMVCQFLLPYAVAGRRPTTDEVAEALFRIEYEDAQVLFSQILALTLTRADEIAASKD